MMYLLLGSLILIFGFGAIAAWFEGLSERPEKKIEKKYTMHTGRVGKGFRKFETITPEQQEKLLNELR